MGLEPGGPTPEHPDVDSSFFERMYFGEIQKFLFILDQLLLLYVSVLLKEVVEQFHDLRDRMDLR